MIHIELRSDVPIYEQIVRQVQSQVVRGVLRPGDQMPSIRKLAESIRTNPNTVARAYQELERLGLIENWVGKGAFRRALSGLDCGKRTVATLSCPTARWYSRAGWTWKQRAVVWLQAVFDGDAPYGANIEARMPAQPLRTCTTWGSCLSSGSARCCSCWA